MAGENGQRAVDLLGQNDAGELVGQRDGSKREQQAGARTGCSGPAVGRADGEHQRLRAGVAEAADGCAAKSSEESCLPWLSSRMRTGAVRAAWRSSHASSAASEPYAWASQGRKREARARKSAAKVAAAPDLARARDGEMAARISFTL